MNGLLRYGFAILGLVLATWLCAQVPTRTVVVLDSLDLTPVVDAAVVANGMSVPLQQGVHRLPINISDTTRLRVARPGYVTKELTVIWSLLGSIPLRVLLAPIVLEAVPVLPRAPEVVFQRTDVHAADLLINDDGLWVLAYQHPRMLRSEAEAGEEILRDVRLVLLDTLFREVARCAVPEDVRGLRRDAANTALIEGTDRAFSIGRREDDGGLVLLPFGLKDLRERIMPWTDTVTRQLVGTNTDAVRPGFDHLLYRQERDSTRVICTVVDSFMMSLFRSEYKYLKGPEKVVAMNLASELGVDKETVAGYMSGFQHNIWFKPMYAPLFVVGDTLLVFDHGRARLRKFTRDLREMPSVELSYMERPSGRDWAGRLVQDRSTRQVYAVFQRNGMHWLRTVDATTGQLGDRRRITHKYPERLQVHDGHAWYIHRPVESLQKRTIYRERLVVD